jgi:hypothetical protein
MNRTLLWSLLAVIALAVLWSVAWPVIPNDTVSAVITKAVSDTRQVGLAAKLYANDHEGRLPGSLNELVPQYLPDKTLLPHVRFATPRTVLAELPPTAIILFRVATDEDRHETRVIVVHPDISVEWSHP